jgi:hypothetical protein
MATHTKYGFCKASGAWVPRDEMLGLNIKAFDADNNEQRIQIRLSEDEWKRLVQMLKTLTWENDLRTAEQLRAESWT